MGQEENFEVTMFPTDMFNQDIPERQAEIDTMDIGWTGVTREDILQGQGLEAQEPSELDGQILQNQLDNRTLLARWQTAHGLEDKQGALWKGPTLVVVGNNDLNRGVITLFHNSLTAGHPGIVKTMELLSQYY